MRQVVRCQVPECQRFVEVEGETFEEWHAAAEQEGWFVVFRFDAVCPEHWREVREEVE